MHIFLLKTELEEFEMPGQGAAALSGWGSLQEEPPGALIAPEPWTPSGIWSEWELTVASLKLLPWKEFQG